MSATGPPIGTVTCLFSDIEGSTRLELDLGTGPYRDVLGTRWPGPAVRHNAIASGRRVDAGRGHPRLGRASALRWYDEALAIWRARDDPREIANALYNRAYADMIEVMGGQATADTLGPGQAMLLEALDIYRALGDQGGEGNVVWGLGSFHYFTKDARTAEGWFRTSLELHRAAGNRSMEAWALHMIALAGIGQRQFDAAKGTARHALKHFDEAGDVSGVMLVLDDLAQIAVASGDNERGGRLWGAARQIQDRTGTTLADYIEQSFELFGVLTPRQAMAAADLARTAAEGAAMGLDEVVAYALEVEAAALPDNHAETTS